MIGEFIILLLLILVNGVFAMAELSIVSARRTRLKQLASAGSHGARAALRLLEHPTRFLSTVQTGITLISVLAGVYSGAKFAEPLQAVLEQYPLIAKQAEPIAFGVVVVLVTYLSLVIGELVPKRWGMTHPESLAILLAPGLEWVARATAPLVWLLQRSTDMLLRLLRMRSPAQSSLTEEEIRTLIAEGTREGVFHKAEHSMIEGVLKLADRSVRSIMVPRGDVAWLDIGDPRDVLIQEVRSSAHSRYLVCRGELDELVGIARTRDLLQWMRGDVGGEGDLAKFTRPALVVQETTTVLKLLELFRESAMHFAVVVDEHGSIEGIVTPTDVLQAIAGDLPDVDSADAPEAVRRDDASWLMDGRIPIGEVERILGRSDMVSGEDYTTLAGFVLAQLGHVPATAESFSWKGLRFEVMDMDGRRIDKVLIQPSQAPSSRSTT